MYVCIYNALFPALACKKCCEKLEKDEHTVFSSTQL